VPPPGIPDVRYLRKAAREWLVNVRGNVR
jgi:hypothetical protein